MERSPFDPEIPMMRSLMSAIMKRDVPTEYYGGFRPNFCASIDTPNPPFAYPSTSEVYDALREYLYGSDNVFESVQAVIHNNVDRYLSRMDELNANDEIEMRYSILEMLHFAGITLLQHKKYEDLKWLLDVYYENFRVFCTTLEDTSAVICIINQFDDDEGLKDMFQTFIEEYVVESYGTNYFDSLKNIKFTTPWKNQIRDDVINHFFA